MNTRDVRPTHLFHPDIEWHWAAAIPGPTVFHGHEELADGLDTWIESWEDDGLVRRWWMFGDAEKARRRFVAGDRPG